MSQSLYEQGLAAEQRGDTAAAIDVYEQILAENPKYIDAIAALGRLQFEAPEQPFLDEVRRKFPDKKAYSVVIEVRNPCNFRCFYCVAKGANNTPVQELNLQSIEKIYEQIKEHVIITSFECDGGEPTIHPQFPELIRLCSKYGAVSFPSNNSQNPERWLPKETASRLLMRSALHPEAEPKLDQYLKYARYLIDNGVRFVSTFISHPTRIHKIPEYRKRFAEQDIPFTPVSFIGDHEDKRYPPAHTEEEMEIMGLNNESRYWLHRAEPQMTRIRNFRGIPCIAGHQSLHIGSKGELRRCLYDYRILDKPLDSPEPCKIKSCGCGMMLEKLNTHDNVFFYNDCARLAGQPMVDFNGNPLARSLGYECPDDAMTIEQIRMYDALMKAYGKDKFPENP